jgi:hypothetical protein
MTGTIPLGTAKLFFETIGHVLFFPIWWYSRGLVGVLRFVGHSIRNQYESLGLGVWLSNLFVPMYGTTDLAGRLISFLVRFFMVLLRGLYLMIWTVIVFVLLVVYLLLLPFSVVGLIYHFIGLVIPSAYVFF